MFCVTILRLFKGTISVCKRQIMFSVVWFDFNAEVTLFPAIAVIYSLVLHIFS